MVKDRYMIGYSSDKKPFAILDQDGFKPATEKPVSFAPDVELGYASEGTRVFWSHNSARYAFLGEQKVVDVPMPAPVPIYGEGNAFASKGQVSVETAGFALGTGMAIFDDKAAPVAFLPYRHDVSKWGQIQLGINGSLDRFYLWYKPSGFIDIRSKWYQSPGSADLKLLASMPAYIDVTDAQGTVLTTYTLPPVLSDPRRPRTWVMYLAMRLQTPAFFFGDILYKKTGELLGSKRLKDELAWELGSIYSHDDIRGNVIWLPPIYAILGLLALVWARQAYFPWPRAWRWAVFVAAFGVPGLVAFRLASDWPCLVPCPKCEKPRPVDASYCPVCNAAWPNPSKTGVEIFDNARSENAAVALA